MKKVTMEKIGQQLNISKVAVYKALNDQPGVSAQLKQKIKETAANLGYEFVSAKQKTNLKFIYLIKTKFFLVTSEQFYTSIYYYLNIECEKLNYKLSIVFLDEGEDELKTLKSKLSSEQISGIYVAGEIEPKILNDLKGIELPLVFIDFYSPLHNFTYIYLDSYHLSYIATNYLIAKGHKHIGFVGDNTSTSSICDRYLGYQKALIENKLPVNSEWHINKNIEHSVEVTNVLPKKLPTAFICHCDSAAHKIYLLLKLRNLSVPGDVSVVGFDNTDLCENVSPALTSIGTNKSSYAKKSFNAMIDLINTNKKSVILLKANLAERGSVKDLNV